MEVLMKEEEIREFCRKHRIKQYSINDDMSIDVYENVSLFYSLITEIPVMFNNVYGNFSCTSNQITSLKNAPKFVEGKFLCNNNDLTSLKHIPSHIGTLCDCGDNNLTTIDLHEDFYCGGEFFCDRNPISTRLSLTPMANVHIIYSDNLWKF